MIIAQLVYACGHCRTCMESGNILRMGCNGYELVSGRTDNHLVLVNLKNKGIDGSRPLGLKRSWNLFTSLPTKIMFLEMCLLLSLVASRWGIY